MQTTPSHGIDTSRALLPIRRTVGGAVVLCSRGFSFVDRLHTAVNWAIKCGVENVLLLHCPEDKYSPAFVQAAEQRAIELFAEIDHTLAFRGKRLNFEFLCCPGLLHDNLAALIEQGDVRIVFVGRKMLDYRASEIKHLAVPFFFLG